MHIRYNSSAKYWEYDTGSGWAQLDLSADVPWDLIATHPIIAKADVPHIGWWDTNGATNQKRFTSYADSGELVLSAIPDDWSGNTPICYWTRDGTLRVVKGIRFPVTQNPSSNANELDDYEENSFTPYIGGSTSESGQAYSTQYGYYTKVGNRLDVFGRITMSTLGTITGNVLIKGFPFTNTSNHHSPLTIGFVNGLNTSVVWLGAMVTIGQDYGPIYMRTAAQTSVTNLTQSDLTSTFDIIFGGTYRV